MGAVWNEGSVGQCGEGDCERICRHQARQRVGQRARTIVSEVEPLAPEQIARIRLRNQCIAFSPGVSACATPHDVVTHLGALQGQDYAGVLWSIGLRVAGSTEASIERAFAEREIVRTWPMRGTLHVIPAADARWMLELLTPRMIASTARRRENLSLDDAEIARAARLFTGALRGGNRLTRDEMMALLEGAGIVTAGQRGYHILFHLSMRRLIVFGPREGKQQTFVLFDEWLPDAPSLSRSASLALIVRRYFTSHGPASAKDFAGWTGLTIADAKAGLAANADTLVAETVGATTYWTPRECVATTSGPFTAGGSAGMSPAVLGAPPIPDVHLLPGFDEFLLGYKDRSAALHADHSERVTPGGNGVFRPTVVIDGQIVGTWKRVAKRGAANVEATAFGRFTAAEQRAIDVAAKRYLAFIA